MIVHKFGGTSVGDAERFASVADIVIDHHRGQDAAPRQETVVVVSAMSGVTNRLIAGARAAAEGKDTVYREIKAGLLSRHLDVVETLLHKNPERLDVGGLDRGPPARAGALLPQHCHAGRADRPRPATPWPPLASSSRPTSWPRSCASAGVRAQAVSATELIVTDDHFGAATPLHGPDRASDCRSGSSPWSSAA